MQDLQVNQWFSREAILESELSAPAKGWLCHVDSMTALIKQEVKQQFELLVLREGAANATPAEIAFLNLEQSSVYAREIIMKADGVDWLFARSVFPQQIMELDEQKLLKLGNQPLGRVLFANNEQHSGTGNPRKLLEVGYLSSTHELLQTRFFPQPQELSMYARRSLFEYHDNPVLVQEVFLPEHPLYHVD